MTTQRFLDASAWLFLVAGLALTAWITLTSQPQATWLAAATGIAISLLLFCLRRTLANIRGEADHIAEQLTADIRAREAALRDSELRWKFALEGSALGVWDWHIPSDTLYTSPRCAEMLGYQASDAPTHMEALRQHVHPDDQERAQTALHACLVGERSQFDHELRMLARDGTALWVWARGMVVERDAAGKPVRMIGTQADTTRLLETEQRALLLARLYAAQSACNAAVLRCRSPDELFRQICQVVVEHGGMAMAWIGQADPASGVVRVVAAHGTGTDYLDGLAVTTDDAPSGHGPTGTAIRDNHSVWLENFGADPSTLPWQEHAQGYGWVACAGLPIRRDGEPVAALTFYAREGGWFTPEIRQLLEDMAESIGFALDKLDHESAARRYQRDLATSEQRFRGMIEQTITGIYVTVGLRIVYANPRFCEITGYQEAELVGHQTFELLAGQEEALRTIRDRLEAGARSAHAVLPFRAKDGQMIDLGIHVSPGIWGGQQAHIVMAQDITERKRAEDRIASYVKQLEGAMRGTLDAVARMAELRDPYTAGHQRRVAQVAVDIARAMGWSEERCRTLELAGLVHDIGKIAIPAEVLAKPGRLTDLEYEIIKTHAERGYEILKDVQFPLPIAEIIREHHERLDGSGYPHGLKGEQILPEARVLGVADVLESMASHRPYRPAVGPELAIEELAAHRGTFYDPAVVDAVLRMVREQGYRVPT